MPDGRVLEDALVLYGRTSGELALELGVSDRTLRNWRRNESEIEPDRRASAARFFGVQNWEQLHAFTTECARVYSFDNVTADLGIVWEYYIDRVDKIFETRIALSGYDSFHLGFSERLNKRAIEKIKNRSLSVRRIEQVLDIERLMQLQFNSEFFRNNHHYALRVVAPPGSTSRLIAYPNFVRFGKEVLAIGRIHTEGMPTHDPFLLLRGSGIVSFAMHLEQSVWDDGALFTTNLQKAPHELARQLAPSMSAEEYDVLYKNACERYKKEPPRI
ncbi:MAG: helix-turn-helix transcriptional regulator [Parvularculaceae bacterium]|nr:helix-turn-helix transcriptional regulator [Parvularculaceae bacterium]